MARPVIPAQRREVDVAAQARSGPGWVSWVLRTVVNAWTLGWLVAARCTVAKICRSGRPGSRRRASRITGVDTISTCCRRNVLPWSGTQNCWFGAAWRGPRWLWPGRAGRQSGCQAPQDCKDPPVAGISWPRAMFGEILAHVLVDDGAGDDEDSGCGPSRHGCDRVPYGAQ